MASVRGRSRTASGSGTLSKINGFSLNATVAARTGSASFCMKRRVSAPTIPDGIESQEVKYIFDLTDDDVLYTNNYLVTLGFRNFLVPGHTSVPHTCVASL
jgi:hypothetical protein